MQGNYFLVREINYETTTRAHQYVDTQLSAIVKENVPAYIKVDVYKDPRSLKANALLWVWHKQIAKHLNAIGKRVDVLKDVDGKTKKVGEREYTDKDVHYQMKCKFLGMEKVQYGNNVVERPASSKKLNHSEFCFFMTQIEEMALTYFDLVLEVRANDEYSKYKEAQLK